MNKPSNIYLLLCLVGLAMSVTGCHGSASEKEITDTFCMEVEEQTGDTVTDWHQYYFERHQQKIEHNRAYYDTLLLLDAKILQGDDISLAEAKAAMPRTADQVSVLFGYDSQADEARGFRIDSVCYALAVAHPDSMIALYLQAASCSDGYVGEEYLTSCFLLWKQYPQKVESALNTLQPQAKANFLGTFREWKDWEENQHTTIQR